MDWDVSAISINKVSNLESGLNSPSNFGGIPSLFWSTAKNNQNEQDKFGFKNQNEASDKNLDQSIKFKRPKKNGKESTKADYTKSILK